MASESSAPISPEEFLKNLGDSGLLPPEEIFSALETLSGSSSIVDSGDLAKRLVSAGKLTSFQANAVLEQRLQELQVGNYEVLDRLGAGAMGTVYKARHRRMKRIVALKVLSRSLAHEGFVQRFQREVETLAQLTHPNIIMAFDADEAEVGHFLVMEFVDGRDLASLIQKNGKLPVTEAIDAILQAARGLAYAHAKNIIHRDIKPANIMRDNQGVIKVADLGLARLAGVPGDAAATAVTQAGSIVGTVDYMPPEQAVDSTTIDHRADIYSLGCTLYYLLTAQPVYQGASVMAVLLKHRDGPIPNLRAARPDVPTELQTLFENMVAKDVSRRTASMGEVVSALESLQTRLAQAPSAAAPAVPTVGNLTVVMVEPSRTLAGILRRFLQELGVTKIHAAATGKQALELARQHGADLLISTLHLDDMTGMQLAKLHLADPVCAHMSFILTTSGSEAEDISELRAMPRTVLMPKPFDAPKLAAAIATAVGR